MINEVVQWAVIAAIGVLLLGVLRQVSLMLPSPARTTTRSGPRVGDRLSKNVLSKVQAARPTDHGEDTLVAFVTQSCVGCQRLLGLVTDRPRDSGEAIVLVAKDPSAEFRAALAETSVPTIYDLDGALWEAVGVTATPLVIRIDGSGQVLAKGVTHDVDAVSRPGQGAAEASPTRH